MFQPSSGRITKVYLEKYVDVEASASQLMR